MLHRQMKNQDLKVSLMWDLKPDNDVLIAYDSGPQPPGRGTILSFR